MTDGHYYEIHAYGISIRIAANPDANLDEAKIVALAKLALAELKRQIEAA
jgi:hypothetical protein